MRSGSTALAASAFFALGLVLVLSATLAPLDALAQSSGDSPRGPGSGAVSILTEAPGEGDDRAIDALGDLSRQLARTGTIRVLPIIGRGVMSNVRDLLYQRGIDFAILGSDTFAYLDQIGQLREARSRVRYVTHLYDRRLLLFTRPEINGIADLAGRRVAAIGSDSSAHAMATTVLGLLSVPARLEAVPALALQDRAVLAPFEAILLLDHDLTRPAVREATRDMIPRPIAGTAALDRVYHRGLVLPSELPDAKLSTPFETVAASMLLVSFDWNPGHQRYGDIRRFVGVFLASLPALKRENPTTIWRHANIAARPPGWTRHQLAQPERALTDEQRAQLTTTDVLPRIPAPPPAPQPQLAAGATSRPVVASPVVAPAVVPSPAGGGEAGAGAARQVAAASEARAIAGGGSSGVPSRPPVRVIVADRPPFADRRAPEGGILVHLLREALQAAEPAGAPPPGIDIAATLSDPTGFAEQSVDLFLPWEQTDCDRPNELGRTSALLCDGAIASDPMLQVVIGLFGPADRRFEIDGAEPGPSRNVCIEDNRDSGDLNAGGRQWIATKRAVLVRRPSLLDCIGAVASGDADAFVASDLEAGHLLKRLGLAATFRMVEQPLATKSLHVAVAADRPGAKDLVRRINAGLAALKQTDAYASLLKRHLMSLWSGETARLQ